MHAVSEKLRQGFSLDRRSIALFRILLGIVLIIDLSMDFRYADDLYSRTGLFPRSIWASYYEYTTIWSLHTLFDTVVFARLMIGLQIGLAVALVVGYRSRIVAGLSWVLFVSLINRNLLVTDGGDQIASYLLFIAMCLPLGETFSVDRRRLRSAPQLSPTVFSAGTIMLVAQLTILYVFAGITKLEVTDWRDGSALDLILRWNEYARQLAPLFRKSAALSRLVSVVTPWFECVGALAFFIPDRRGILRILAVLGFVGLHLAIHLSLSLSLFSFYPMAGLSALLPASFWRFVGRRWDDFAARNRLAVRFKWLSSDRTIYVPAQGASSPLRRQASARVAMTAGIFVAVCSAYSAFPAVVSDKVFPYPTWLENLNNVTFGWQNWNLFHQPPHSSGWYRACAMTQDGRLIDLLDRGEAYSTAKPVDPTAQYPTRRWFAFFLRAHTLWTDSFFRQATARLLAVKRNDYTPKIDQVVFVRIVYFREHHVPFGPDEKMDPYLYASWQADGVHAVDAACYQDPK